ncbi:hypothetical protein ND748_17155 [Frankia sp. AiPs1]|uniref:hypothetical protein n=1 Tax=Frankia sp. AiPs1 TaxID=573493 RepID=UPI002042E8CE|nr:hypothetical protein [Frankia sp. AiPs1]MCM3923383.1 hypothetical protein [Frankia sp. AiPs1]
MPPVALTASTASAIVPPPAGRGGPSTAGATDEPAGPAVLTHPARPQLRLVASAEGGVGGPEPEVHGWGGPATCSCRECAMARHPAAMPRLSVVR